MSLLPHTDLAVGTVAPLALVCGDPARATAIASRLEDVTLLAEKREYRTYNGRFRSCPMSVSSHGVGAPGAAIGFEELIAAGARTLIRVGSCGGLQPHVRAGDVVVATAAVQQTGYGRQTVPEGYPAVADVTVTTALRQAAARHGAHHTGIVLTCDNFYNGVATPFAPDYRALAAANVLAVEMECAALFVVGSLRGVATGAVLAVDGNVLETAESMETFKPQQTQVQAAVAAAIEIALKTAVALYQAE